MAEKPKCGVCNERDVFAKGKCSRCYAREWQQEKKAERDAKALVPVEEPKQLTGDVIEGEIVSDNVSASAAPEVHLVARNPSEMNAAQEGLRLWLEQKLAGIGREITDTNRALNEARKYNWATDALTRARNRLVAAETYYFKLLQAVEAGYTIIPDFPVDIFAIRVTRAGVRAEARSQSEQWGWPNIDNETPDLAPAGAGVYRNPSQLVRHTEEKTRNDKGEEKIIRWTEASNWQDEILFPMTAARPAVMSATAEAMALKVFDQIGVCRRVEQSPTGRAIQSWGKGDPLIIGQICHRRASVYRVTSFIIGWTLDVNDL